MALRAPTTGLGSAQLNTLEDSIRFPSCRAARRTVRLLVSLLLRIPQNGYEAAATLRSLGACLQHRPAASLVKRHRTSCRARFSLAKLMAESCKARAMRQVCLLLLRNWVAQLI